MQRHSNRKLEVEPTPITHPLLPPVAEGSSMGFSELTEEEVALRHKLELKVERALYRAAVVLQAHQDESSAHYLDWGFGNEQKVERAFCEVEMALQELRDRCLYRSTHRSFNQYLRDRFGSCVVEVLPAGS